MKLLILYHLDNEFSSSTEHFAEECKKKTSKQVDLVSIETQEGASLAASYDMVDFPAIIVAREDGQVVKFWQGSNLPLLDEVIGYLNQ